MQGSGTTYPPGYPSDHTQVARMPHPTHPVQAPVIGMSRSQSQGYPGTSEVVQDNQGQGSSTAHGHDDWRAKGRPNGGASGVPASGELALHQNLSIH